MQRSVDGRPLMVVTMGGYRISALVDTGASSSLLREDIFLAMARKVRRTHFVRATHQLQGISGSTLPLKGRTEVKIDKVDNPLPVDIITKMGPELIIGQDWLRKGRAVIDFPQKRVSWFGQEWPILRSWEDIAAGIAEVGLPCMGFPEGDSIIRKYADVFSGERDSNRQ